MTSKEEILLIYHAVKQTEDISEELLIKILLEYVLDLDFDKVNLIKSEISSNDSFNLTLISKNNNCDIYFEIIENNTFDIQINNGVEYLYYFTVKDWADVKKLRGALESLFKSEVLEEVTYCDGKVIKAKYSVNHLVDGKIIPGDYAIALGNCFFWNQKKVETKKYEPWIDK